MSETSGLRWQEGDRGDPCPMAGQAYGITLKGLRELTECHGVEAVAKLSEKGGLDGLCLALGTSPTEGIVGSEADLQRRRDTFGTNAMPVPPTKSLLQLAWKALNDVTLVVLEVAALLTLAVSLYNGGDSTWIEAVAILVSVLVVVTVTAVNDSAKERQFRSLQTRARGHHMLNVVRGGQVIQIGFSELVVGDLCLVKYGDLVPADGVVVQSNDLKVDESALTGESAHVNKGPLVDPVVLSGTHVIEGSGRMVVTSVGVNSQTGILALLMMRHKAVPGQPGAPEGGLNAGKGGDSVLQDKLTSLSVWISYVGLSIAFLTVIVLIIKFCISTFVVNRLPWNASYVGVLVHYLIIGVTILVVVVPEGLPLAVTLSLAYSVKKMTKDNILVRHLYACETMGNATSICSDKTGTLTTNRMTVVQSYICGKLHLTTPSYAAIPPHVGDLIIQGISVNSSYSSRVVVDSAKKGLPSHLGNQTECGLLAFVLALGKDYEAVRLEIPESTFTRVYTFNSVRKSMSTVLSRPSGGYRLYTKGASEVVLGKCAYIMGESGLPVKITQAMHQQLVNEAIQPMALASLRTLIVAYRDFVREKPEPNQALITSKPNWDDEASIVSELTALCIVGIEDPVRSEVPDAILRCKRAGIVVRMVTGDNIDTARSIAQKCGILPPEVGGGGYLVLDGKEFNQRIRDTNGVVQQHLLDRVWPKLRVLARSSPTDKYVLVQGIMESTAGEVREVVAVTGDGTNDGPALRRADVGFAMGITGTDVAREASDIIILDDNFCSIVSAVMWGRNVYDSITKFLQFQMTVNLVAMNVSLVGAAFIQDNPLRAVQMLWVNLIMDTLASLSLATESPTPDLLLRKPYGRTQPLISRTMTKFILGHAVYQLTVLFTLLFVGDEWLDIPSGRDARFGDEPTQHFTIIFNVFVMMSLFNEINARKVHGERNVFRGLFIDPMFYRLWFCTMVVQCCIVQAGGTLGTAFGTAPLTLEQWLWCVLLGAGTLLWGQLLATVPSARCVPEYGTSSQPVDLHSPRAYVLWVTGISRVRSQLRVVESFRASLNGLRPLEARKSVQALPEIPTASQSAGTQAKDSIA